MSAVTSAQHASSPPAALTTGSSCINSLISPTVTGWKFARSGGYTLRLRIFRIEA